jgi:hypothetical protein
MADTTSLPYNSYCLKYKLIYVHGKLLFIDEHGNRWIICASKTYAHLIPITMSNELSMLTYDFSKGYLTDTLLHTIMKWINDNYGEVLVSWSNHSNCTVTHFIDITGSSYNCACSETGIPIFTGPIPEEMERICSSCMGLTDSYDCIICTKYCVGLVNGCMMCSDCNIKGAK